MLSIFFLTIDTCKNILSKTTNQNGTNKANKAQQKQVVYMETERQNIFKGQTEEEIKKAFNNKWLEIIKNCTYKKRNETQ